MITLKIGFYFALIFFWCGCRSSPFRSKDYNCSREPCYCNGLITYVFRDKKKVFIINKKNERIRNIIIIGRIRKYGDRIVIQHMLTTIKSPDSLIVFNSDSLYDIRKKIYFVRCQ